MKKICKRRERRLVSPRHCLIAFCACTYTETQRVFIVEENEFTHSPTAAGACQASVCEVLLFSGMVLQLLLCPPSARGEEKWGLGKKEERHLNAPQPTRSNPVKHPPAGSSSLPSVFLVYVYVPSFLVAVAIFAGSLV